MRKIIYGIILVVILSLLVISVISKSDKTEEKVLDFVMNGTYKVSEGCLDEINPTYVIIYEKETIEIANNDVVTFYKYEKDSNYEGNRLVHVKDDSGAHLFKYQFKNEQIFFPFVDDGITRVCQLEKIYNLPINSHHDGE